MTPSLMPEAWAQIRYAYEHSDRPIHDICAEYGISTGTLRDRMRRWGWTRRRAPIPRQGPPAMMPPVDVFSPPPIRTRIDASRRPGTGSADDEEGSGVGGHFAAETAEDAPPTPLHSADADADPADIVPRLQGAVPRVLAAIEATLRRLTAGPLRPHEIEQTGRALGTLTRTLRELNALLKEHPENGRDEAPIDIDAFRYELARRINEFVAAEKAVEAEADAASSSVRPRGSEDPGAEESEQAAAGLPLARE